MSKTVEEETRIMMGDLKEDWNDDELFFKFFPDYPRN